ncbi:MAG: hypothetical protein ABIS36_16065 [Chryseolinea sp.]
MERFQNEVVVYLKNLDGLGIELVFNEGEITSGFTYAHIPQEHSIKGFFNVESWEEGFERTAGLLT